MIKGLYYGIFYFLFIPLIVFSINGFNLDFLPLNEYFDFRYDLSVETIYACTFILIALIATAALSEKWKLDLKEIRSTIESVRSKPIGIFIFGLFFFLSLSDFLIIDHSQHWLERQRLSLISPTIHFYINPVGSFTIFISLIHIAIFILNPIRFLFSRRSWISVFWIIVDLVYLYTIISNSGNRWYAAMLFVLAFLLGSQKEKILITLLSPLVILAGGILAQYLIALRVGTDPLQLILNRFGGTQLGEFYSLSVLEITEGFNLGTLINLSHLSLFNPDPLYAINRIVTLPFPNSFVEKLPTFNIHTTHILLGDQGNYSINPTLLGIFIYACGIFAIPTFLIFVFALRKWKIRSHKDGFKNLIYFSLIFAAMRFNFEYLIVHLIYFYILFFSLERRWARRRKEFQRAL